MFEQLHHPSATKVIRDTQGVIRQLVHTDRNIEVAGATPQLAARDYLVRHGDLFGIASSEFASLGHEPVSSLADAGMEFRFISEKSQFDTTTVSFSQTVFGIPVWEAGLAVNMKRSPFRIVSAQTTRHPEVKPRKPAAKSINALKALTTAALAKQIGIDKAEGPFDKKTLRIERINLVVYRYSEKRRGSAAPPPKTKPKVPVLEGPLLPTLPPIGKGIKDGEHYVAGAVYFRLDVKKQGRLHWVAILEADTLSVLLLRPFVDHVSGQVFVSDPQTASNTGPAPSANSATLNPFRTSVTLPGLTAPAGGANQALTGSLVALSDVEGPAIAAPTEPSGTNFNYDSRTNKFAAVNAYYHCDRFFRLVEELGFDHATYFSASTFPSPVDHRGYANTDFPTGEHVNAHCLGGAGGVGILQTAFALADTGDVANPIGIAADWRVVLHELGGHGILYNHVNFANFGFAHSAGDSFAAILSDPETQATDRFVTFPWIPIGRRHDRTPAGGYGWGGNIAINPFAKFIDDGGYENEQILSSTMFRIYRSIGGDASTVEARTFAARFVAYLMLRAVGTLTPATNPTDASGFAVALTTADAGDWTSEGHAGGAYTKVIRWSFEKQGLCQPAGTAVPNNNEGVPPPVDVYIDDGRLGEYTYQANHWSCQSIWNRLKPDGGLTHEDPRTNEANFAYVKIKNRGSEAAANVVVKAFHCQPGVGLNYPDDWQPMTTPELPVEDVPPNNAAEVLVGPFEWTPSQEGHECIFMVLEADGDASNLANFTAGDSIPEWRLVPNDNNIGQRNVQPVEGGKLTGLTKSFNGRKFTFHNPHRVKGRAVLKAVLPDFLAKRSWRVLFTNPGGGAFSLEPRSSRVITMKLQPGEDFTRKDLPQKEQAFIHIEAYINGILVGGMSYLIDPELRPS